MILFFDDHDEHLSLLRSDVLLELSAATNGDLPSEVFSDESKDNAVLKKCRAAAEMALKFGLSKKSKLAVWNERPRMDTFQYSCVVLLASVDPTALGSRQT